MRDRRRPKLGVARRVAWIAACSARARGSDAALAHTGLEHAVSFACRLQASLDRPRPHAGDGGGRAVGRPQRRAGAVGLAGGVRRRDGGGRRARHRRRAGADGGARHPRLGRSSWACWCWPRRACRSRWARRSLPSSPCCTATRTARSCRREAAAATYAAGFALATALLHALGLGVAYLAPERRRHAARARCRRAGGRRRRGARGRSEGGAHDPRRDHHRARRDRDQRRPQGRSR